MESLFNLEGFKLARVINLSHSVRQEGNADFARWVQSIFDGTASVETEAPVARHGQSGLIDEDLRPECLQSNTNFVGDT